MLGLGRFTLSLIDFFFALKDVLRETKYVRVKLLSKNLCSKIIYLPRLQYFYVTM